MHRHSLLTVDSLRRGLLCKFPASTEINETINMSNPRFVLLGSEREKGRIYLSVSDRNLEVV